MRATRVVAPLLVCAVLLAAGASAQSRGAANARETRDAQGRVQSRLTLAADGSRRVEAYEYWGSTETKRRRTGEEIDAAGRIQRRTTETFDRKGRVRERRAVTIDAAGGEKGTLSRFDYDGTGRARESVAPVGR